jgi:uncharacterized protein with von Willebrand factor type A (vWA) domain
VTEPERALPEAALDRLASATAPFLIGVRHHSPALSAAMPALLEAFDPTAVLIELPAELEAWLPWLGHDETVAPVALAATPDGDPGSLCFYPFADFSPELVAIRWAHARNLKIKAIDLPVAEREPRSSSGHSRDERGPPKLESALLSRSGSEDFEDLWDRWIEARAEGQPPEAIRRAALALGWMLRYDEAVAGVASGDLRRESFMRRCVDEALGEPGARVVCVVGAFHASALADVPPFAPIEPFVPSARSRAVITSMSRYGFELLDSRSGYPAGIRDPAWQQLVVEALSARTPVEALTFDAVTRIARVVRASRHVASFPDASEAARIAVDLARLRGLSAPSRRELLEGITSAMTHGEPLGRGRVIARALESVLVGSRHGTLAPGTPRSGLGPHVEALFAEIRLPMEREQKEITLDPLRSALDRRREIALERCVVAGIAYAERIATGRTAAGIDALGSRWRVGWSVATDATVDLAGHYGVTLAGAARGLLLRDLARARDATARRAGPCLDLIAEAARAGIADFVEQGLASTIPDLLAEATFVELVSASELVSRIARGHIPALPILASSTVPEAPLFTADTTAVKRAIVEALVRSVEGLAGSTSLDDARALVSLVDGPGAVGLGEARFGAAIDELAENGSPLMQGAATVVGFLLGRIDGASFGARVGSFLDGSVGDPGLASERAQRTRGLVTVAVPLLEADAAFTSAVLERFAAWSDTEFLARLPSLRDGFDALSPAARARLLKVLVDIAAPGAGAADGALEFDLPPAHLAALAEANDAAALALAELGLSLPSEASRIRDDGAGERSGARSTSWIASGTIAIRDRLRLALGRERTALPPREARYAIALDRLYGRGEGEGSRDGDGGGGEAAFPSVRVWSDEIAALFGEDVRQEVAARAAERGDASVALDLDPDKVRPSVELLSQILSLKGGLAEGDVTKLRILVKRIVDDLVAALATRVRPALAGLVSPRATLRPSGPPDLRRTIARNLRTARPNAGGGFTLAPERIVFRQRSRRSLDWHVVLLVDVSGSMEPSVVSSALLAAILSGLPALTVHFVAFSDRIVDLTDHASDPLSLLLEISIGGGTHIARAVHYARSIARVPSRTLCVLVTDFEEGGNVADLVAEVRALVESGAKALGLAALDDRGAPRFAAGIAELVAGAGMPVAALSPTQVARWIAEQIR